MARCEEYPACGHVGEDGPCPDFDPETGEQLNMRCVCGAAVPITSRSSLCKSCLRDPDGFDDEEDPYEDEDDDDGDDDDSYESENDDPVAYGDDY